MKKVIEYIDIFARVVVIIVAVVLGLRVFIYSTELWRRIFIIAGIPLVIYNTIKYGRSRRKTGK